MNGEIVINNLAGLLIVTSLLVIAVNKPKLVALLYSLQSLVLVLTFVAIANTFNAPELYHWSITAVITKVILLPAILYFSFGKMRDPIADKPIISVPWQIVTGGLIMLVSFLAIEHVQLPLLAQLKPALAVSLGHFFLGLLCIVSQRNILKQLFGYCLMENGSSLTLALMANKAPGLVEIGVTIDALFAVIFMVILVRQIYKKLHTLDVQQLTSLKG
ncbi:hydrogenase 4 membrane subunit [Photobacterium angustum]|uniref:Hydrogenase 4 membrane subunit n=1 Tax=Photobacterium angustum TaxID=661 RepID=A0ABX5H0R1_PHOAN|nr:hydrogenase 4 membrane subunit [Photobacterium angustum]KJG37991.1 hydrogenase 4 membrane subunit [Photobacterium angustum]PSX06387.1 hydrogenase 4 membrane subunit [Photobacterium angustum]